MEKTPAAEKRDILQEDYKGTGPLVSGLGYSVIETKVMWFIGAITGGIVGAVAPDTVNRWSTHWQQQGHNAIANNPSGNGAWAAVKRGYGKTITKIFEWSEKLANHMPGKEYAEAHMGGAGGSRMKAVISAAGILSIIAIAGSLIHSFFAGAQSSSAGKDQFALAKKEIKTLRDEKDALAVELESTGKELAKTKAEAHTHAALHAETPQAVVSNAEYHDTAQHKAQHHHGHHA